MPKTQGTCATEGCNNLQAPRGSGDSRSYRKHCKKCRRLADNRQTDDGQTDAPVRPLEVTQHPSTEQLATRRASDLAAIAQNKALLELSDEDLTKWMINRYTVTVVQENYHKLPRSWQKRLSKGAKLRAPHVMPPSAEQLISFRASLAKAITDLENGLNAPRSVMYSGRGNPEA